MKIVLTEPARSLRQRSTMAERELWFHLRDRRLMGCKFKRQVPRGRYVVDFLCVEANLVVEVDGGQHAESRAARDGIRTRYLEAQGLKVLRIWNNEVLQNLDGVLTLVAQFLPQGNSPSPGAQSAPSSPQGERRSGLGAGGK